ncbi:LysR substrate-binding domain-containing protein, partial [Escherichia coli]|uniref:LysR substrate-binding domain-containing protein n=1 Tax=Escherichia coli TaxID=562 RepID=UPI00192A404B
ALGEPTSPRLPSRITVQTYQLARALVEAGEGMTLVDPFTAASADPAKVRVRPLAPTVPVQLVLLSAASAPLGQASRRLVKFITAAAHEHLARLP